MGSYYYFITRENKHMSTGFVVINYCVYIYTHIVYARIRITFFLRDFIFKKTKYEKLQN